MLLTDRFIKVIKYFFVFTCLLFVYTLTLSILDLYGYSQIDDSLSRSLLNFTKSLFSILGFATALGYLTKEWLGAIIIAAFQLAFIGFMIYSYGMLPEPKTFYGNSFLYSYVGNFISIVVFGLLYYRSCLLYTSDAADE